MTPIRPRRVAIIGGGYAGMAAAVDLAAAGIAVDILESARVLGGRARRIEYRGRNLDNGQHILSGAYSALLKRMQQVGVAADDAFTRIPLRLAMPPHFLMRAAALPAPFHTLAGLLGASGLTWSDRIAAIRFMLSLRRRNYRVSPEATVAQLLSQAGQPPRLNRFLWVPLTLSALNTHPSHASAQVFVNVLRDALAGTRTASDLLIPRQDLSRLFPDAAAKWVKSHGGRVRLGETARRIDRAGTMVRLESNLSTEEFDGAIVAIGPHQFSALAMPDSIAGPELAYEPIVTAYFHFDVPVSLPEAMLGQPEGCAQWFFDRSNIESSVPGEATIAAVISASGEHSTLEQGQLISRLLRELTFHVNNLPKPVWCKLITEKYATFACTPAAQLCRPQTQTPVANIWMAGDFVAGDYPATLESAVRSGASAAAAAVDYFNAEKRRQS